MSPEKTITVKCSVCGTILEIPISQINTNVKGEKFVSCDHILYYEDFKKPRFCNNYIPISNKQIE